MSDIMIDTETIMEDLHAVMRKHNLYIGKMFVDSSRDAKTPVLIDVEIYIHSEYLIDTGE